MADLHLYANCYSHIQPIGNPNTCNKKRDQTLWDRGLVVKRSYADVRLSLSAIHALLYYQLHGR
jgi:hypothetical protein